MSAARPNLCIVNPYEHGGGAEYQISLLIDAVLEAETFDVHYLAHFLDERQPVRRYAVARIGRGPIPRLGYLMDAPSLYRTLQTIRPRVIYQRVACAYTGICAAYARRHGIPLVWHVAHDTDVSPRLLDPGRNVVRVRLEKWAVDFGARNADRIVVQTQRQATLLETHFGRTPDAVIPNFHPPATEVIDKSGPLTVLWVANLKPWKRPDAFIRLARALEDRHDVQFVMVGARAEGSGNERWQRDLDRSIAAAGNLRYLGRQNHDEVNALLARAHVFVNTSEHEGFPNTFIQAWLRGAVVVSLDVDPDRALERKRVGVAANSEAGLATAVRQLIEDPNLRRGFAERGSDHANALHSLANARELAELLRASRCREG